MLKLIFVCSAYAFFVTQALSKTLCLSPVWLCDSLKMAYAQSRKEQKKKNRGNVKSHHRTHNVMCRLHRTTPRIKSRLIGCNNAG